MQGTYNYIPETNHIYSACSVADILYLQFLLHVMLLPMMNVIIIIIIKGKGKANPLQAWIGAEVSRRLRIPDFKTFGI
jgi:hypothetical protein